MSITERAKDMGVEELVKENIKLKERVEELEGERSRDGLLGQATMEEAYNRITELEEENKKLKEFKTKREESMFYFKAQIERAEPKTAREAEDLQKAKELFEKLYREELYYLEKENKNLRETNMDLNSALMVSSAEIVRLKEELKELKEKLNKAGLEEYGFFNEY